MADPTRRFLTAPGVAARLKSDRAVPMAKRLRKNMTAAEKALWDVLRRVAPEGAHFRKQAPIGPFIVDFASHAAKLVVELEGGAHDAPDVAARDVERCAWIEARGYRVLRFRNEDVLKDTEVVAKYVRLWRWNACAGLLDGPPPAPPPPTPPRKGAGSRSVR